MTDAADNSTPDKSDAKTQSKASRTPNPLIEMMAETAGAEDVDAFADEFAARRNAANAEKFARVPYSERILLVPQCLRASAHCAAEEKGVVYECARCGACAIDEIINEAERLGYKGVFILKGGRAVTQLIDTLKPGAIAGVACNYEGFIGIIECERRGVPVQFVPLLEDGCVDTKVDLDALREFLRRFDPA
jgi:hypothetical protein